jgi:hypothetical protein
MDANYFLGLGLEAERAECAIFRKSFLMEANKVRVGTFFSSFFRPSSNGASL